MKQLFKKIVVYFLTCEAVLLLRRHKPTIVAVTGSVGKTSTKDAIYTAIKTHTQARKSQKSFNSDIGVPLTVLGLPNAWNNPFLWLRNLLDGFYVAAFSRDYPKVLVLETGIDRPGDMARLAKWLKPDIVVLTRFPSVPVHVEYFSSPEAIVSEKLQLVSSLKPDGKLVYNNDDTIIQAHLNEVRQEKIGYGRYLETAFTARGDKTVYDDNLPIGVEFSVQYCGDQFPVFVKDTIGTQHLYSATAAVAVAVELGMSIEAAVTALSELETPPGRMRILPGIKDSLIIDDSYNSSPIAGEQALQALGELSHVKRKVVVLGDMLELGKFSSDEHKRIGAQVAQVADVLFTVGVRARQIAEGALANGLSEKVVFQYEDVARAGRELQALLDSGDVVLIKASQGMRAERIVEEVMAEPLRAGELLVRQEPMWRNLK